MIDQVIVVVYLLISMIIGVYSGRNTNTIEDYAVGQRNFSTSTLVAAISATMISAAGTAGLSGKVYSFGIIYAISFCFGSVIARMVIAFFIAPKMDRFLGLISSGDVLEQLFGTKAKILMGILVLIEGPLLAAAQILATYQISQYFFDVSQETAAIITSTVIILYCFRGGIRAVSYTDVFQFIMIIIAIPIVSALAISKLGGFSSLMKQADEANLLLSGLSKKEIFKHGIILFSLSLTSIFPLTIQRMLMAKNIKQIRNSFFFNGLVTLPFYLIIGILGLSSSLLLPGIEPNFALPAISDAILPLGIKGIVIAGIIAIFMSSADSQMNITTIAVTQDLLRPLLKEKFTPKISIVIARIMFIFTGLFASIIALYAANALDLLFIVMAICNSIYFPGYLLGILGFTPSKRAFWIGVFSGATIAFFLCVILKIFALYAMLSAIAVNMSILLLSHKANKLTTTLFKLKDLKLLLKSNEYLYKNTFFDLKLKSIAVANASYCDIYSLIIIISSLLPFFLYFDYVKSELSLLFISYILTAILALLLILRQSYKFIEKYLFNVFWNAIIFLNLSFQSIFIFSYKFFIIFWIPDFIIILLLLFLLLKKRVAIIHIMFYFITIIIINIFTQQNIRELSIQFICFPFFTHISTLIICLFMFRNRDIAAYQFMTTKLAHEAGRTITSFSSSAAILQNQLPILIEKYNNQDLSTIDLERLKKMPLKLIETSNTSSQNIKKITLWMEQNKVNLNKKNYQISKILKSTLDDNSLSEELIEKIIVEEINDFCFYGDHSQISQVIINILENAHHATKSADHPKIKIWCKETSLYIQDNGTGISKKNLPNIFDEFFSTKGTSGQGLAFCKLIMESHGGDISCESKLGIFTCFRITFPRILTKAENEYVPNIASLV